MNPKEGIVLPSDYPSDEELFKDMHNEEARQRAYVLFMSEKNPTDIATEVGISVGVVRRWIVKDKWNDRLKAVRAQRIEEERIALETFRGDNRLKEVEEQLKAGKKGREMVLELLEAGDLGPGHLKQLADALRAFSDVAARAVGVGEVVEQRNPESEAAASGKVRPPQVVIVAGDGAKVEIKDP